jgi:hypothetical protein
VSKLFRVTRLLAVTLIATSSSLANAQTVAPGPYYATPSWDQTLPASTRFIVLSNFNSQAVLDRDTGLVWERSPSTLVFDGAPPAGTFGGTHAHDHCLNLTVANRAGWHLPTIQELSSLIDSSQSGPALPAGHPFTIATDTQYWSATGYANSISPAFRIMEFRSGAVGQAGTGGGVIQLHVWCVRGGSGVDIQ